MSYAIKILVAPHPEMVGVKIPLKAGANLLGRVSPPCALLFDGSKVSKKHCTFHVVGNRVSVEDHDSSNGVYVNGRKIKNVEIKLKDRLVIGEFTVEVVS